MKGMKKNVIITSGAISLAIVVVSLFSFGDADAVSPKDYGLTEGDVISATGDPDVYIVNENGFKRLFLNPAIFTMYGHLGGWAAVKEVTPTTRDAFETSLLFRDCEAGDPRVHALETTGEDTASLHWLAVSAETAIKSDARFFDKVFCINHAEYVWYSLDYTYVSMEEIPTYARVASEPPPNPTSDRYTSLPECTGQQFSVAPVDLSLLRELSPRGNLGPPGHTFPTDHMYLHLEGENSETHLIDLRAPGDVTIISITSTPNAAMPDGEEYSMHFALCRDVFGYYNHIKKLSDNLKSVIADVPCQVWTVNPGNACSKEISHAVSAGEVIGKVGHLQGNFDFGAYDHRTRLGYIAPQHYGDITATGLNRSRTLAIVCPIDLYPSGPTRDSLYAKILRTVEPQCGVVAQDLAGTLQGNWFLGDGSDDSYENLLAFVHDSNDPTIAVVSIGGTISNAGKMEFREQTSGSVNRRFTDVTFDGSRYCYQNEPALNPWFNPGLSGHVLVEMTNETTVNVEHQTGTCGGYGLPSFVNPTSYTR